MEDNKTIFIKRFKSFLWRVGSYLLVAGISFLADNVGLLHIDPMYQAVIALILGEITKALNTK